MTYEHFDSDVARLDGLRAVAAFAELSARMRLARSLTRSSSSMRVERERWRLEPSTQQWSLCSRLFPTFGPR
jgi:hypothetical protein